MELLENFSFDCVWMDGVSLHGGTVKGRAGCYKPMTLLELQTLVHGRLDNALLLRAKDKTEAEREVEALARHYGWRFVELPCGDDSLLVSLAVFMKETAKLNWVELQLAGEGVRE